MKDLIIVRGGGDLATGTIYKLKQSGFPVLILETEHPSAIRRNVAFCEAVYQGKQTVEDMTCYLARSLEQAQLLLACKAAVPQRLDIHLVQPHISLEECYLLL